MFKLYGFPSQNNKKALYTLQASGAEYTVEWVDLVAGQQHSAEFKKINPVAKVPVLIHDDKVLTESGAIARYVATVQNSALYPKEDYQRALTDQWLDYFTCHLGRWLNTMFFETIVKAMTDQFGKPSQDALAEANKFSQQQFDLVNNHLADKDYLTGELSIADFCAFAYVEQVELLQISLADYAHLSKWYNTMAAHPAVAAVRAQLPKL